MFKSVMLKSIERPQVLVVGRFQDGDIEASIPKKAAFGDVLRAAAGRAEGAGEAGKLAEAFPPVGAGGNGAGENGTGGPRRVIIVGLGKREKFKAGDLRGAGAAVGRRLAAVKESDVVVSLGGALGEVEGLDMELAGRFFAEGLGLLAWDNTTFKGKASDKKKDERPALAIDADKKGFRRGMERGLALAEATNLCRTLSETPPNIATPAWIAAEARRIGKEAGLKVTVMEGKDLEKENFTGHVNVGKASENKPCLIRLEYVPAKAGKKKSKPAVLVGKTMTYDTGGLSLKVNNGMVGMKRDKDGGCAVLAAMRAIATVVKPDRGVVALLCCAENSISDEAYRPDDVLTYRNGVTVEVTNTDAEGRLVLADALCWACEKEDPAYVVDLATLTGGVITALGSTYAGLFCDDDALRARVEAAAERAGERVWRLPLHQEYREMMKSPVADILNSNPNRKAHAGQGAAFLSYFVEEKVPWCHLDIAGVHVSEADAGPYVKGSTGWGVRLLCDLLDAD